MMASCRGFLIRGNEIIKQIIPWTQGSLCSLCPTSYRMELHHDFMSRTVVDCRQRDPKSDHSWDQSIVTLVVLNTKLDAIHDDSMSRAVFDCSHRGPKLDHRLDEGLVAVVVLNTK